MAAESRKHDTKCSELGCIPLAVETYGAWGEEACNAFSYIAMREAILTNCSKSQVLGDLYGRLRQMPGLSLQATADIDAIDY